MLPAVSVYGRVCVCIFSVRLSALKYATIMWHTRSQPPTGSGGRELRFSICCVWPQGNLCIKYNANNNNNTYNKRLQFFRCLRMHKLRPKARVENENWLLIALAILMLSISIDII